MKQKWNEWIGGFGEGCVWIVVGTGCFHFSSL